MATGKLRWGFLSTAQIGRKNWKAVFHSGNGTVVAVASRDVRRAQEFISQCQTEAPMDSAPRALGSYEELLAAPDVDAVYIPLPTGVRKEWVLRAAAAGKHVLCEKPCAVNVEDLREMIAACREHGLQFLDGVMFMHGTRLGRIRESLDDGASVGDIRRVTANFSFAAGPEFFAGNIRARSELEPYGCLGDLGWYCIRFALWTMQWQMPRAVTGRCLNEFHAPGSAGPVPTEFSGELLFDGGVSAGFYCSFITALEQTATVTGTKGFLRVSDFVAPFHGSQTSFEVNNAAHEVHGCDFNMHANWRRVTVAEHSNSHPTSQETNMMRHFAERVHAGTLNDDWPMWTLKIQQVMHVCFESARQGGGLVSL
jgi:predicted dehydrogenase